MKEKKTTYIRARISPQQKSEFEKEVDNYSKEVGRPISIAEMLTGWKDNWLRYRKDK